MPLKKGSSMVSKYGQGFIVSSEEIGLKYPFTWQEVQTVLILKSLGNQARRTLDVFMRKSLALEKPDASKDRKV